MLASSELVETFLSCKIAALVHIQVITECVLDGMSGVEMLVSY